MKRDVPKDGLKPTRVAPPAPRAPKPGPRDERGGNSRMDRPARPGAARGGKPFRKDGFRQDRGPRGDSAGGPVGGGGLKIVHEDADLLIVDKPSGLLSANLPGETRDSLFDRVKDYIKSGRKSRKPARVWIIHRLDKEASGLLVFAKSEKAFHWLKEDFKAKRIKRLYLAVVEGEISGGEGGGLASGTIQTFISEDEFGNARSIGVGETARNTGPDARRERWSKRPPMRPGETPDKPQLAVTHYRVLANGQKRSLVQLRLETGRKNQIRLHMKEMSHPIIGDRRFGATSDPIQRVALHATDLGFTHPSTGQPVRFVSQAPPSFYRSVGVEPPSAQALPLPEPVQQAAAAAEGSWDHVAPWYDQLIEEGRSDHFQDVIVPGTLHLLQPVAGMRVLDIACGQGLLSRKLAGLGLQVVGVDASPRLIESAKERSQGLSIEYAVADARSLGGAGLAEKFDAAICTMALMNIEPMEPVLRGAAELLKPGAPLVLVILHPAFRAPGQTAWGWDEKGAGANKNGPKQFRRVDGYLSNGQTPITMNPGDVAKGETPVQTWTFHRPLQGYIKALSEASFLVESLEEWPSRRSSQPGPRAAEENRARREIPMFLGIRAVKRPD